MKKVYLAAACGAAFLALGSVANAQGTGSSSSGTSTNKCWDVSNNVVRDRSGTDATGPSGDTSKTVGSTASSASKSGSTAPTGTSANANASSRPAGIPDC